VAEVAELLNVPQGSATLLLRAHRWDKEDLLTAFYDNPEKVCLAAGVPAPGAGSRELLSAPAPASAVCAICRESGGGGLTLSSLACGHAYCDGCWSRFVELKLEEGESRLRCPYAGPPTACPLRVPEELVRRLCPPAVAERYAFLLRKSYADESKGVAWCPHANCTQLVNTSEAADEAASGVFVVCGAGHEFCARCKTQEAHAPASCSIVKLWQKKCDDDSETFNWYEHRCSSTQSADSSGQVEPEHAGLPAVQEMHREERRLVRPGVSVLSFRL